MSPTAWRKGLGRINSLTLTKLKGSVLLLSIMFNRGKTFWVSVAECKLENLCTSTVYDCTFQLSLAEFAS